LVQLVTLGPGADPCGIAECFSMEVSGSALGVAHLHW